MGMRLLSLGGVVLAAVGAGMLVAPRPTGWVLRVVGRRPVPPHPANRVAAWGLVLLGLAITALGRLVS